MPGCGCRARGSSSTTSAGHPAVQRGVRDAVGYLRRCLRGDAAFGGMTALAITPRGKHGADCRQQPCPPRAGHADGDAGGRRGRHGRGVGDRLSAFLTAQQKKNPTRQKADRLLALSRGWIGGHPAPYARAVAAAWVFSAGVCLPAIGIWTGLLDGVSA